MTEVCVDAGLIVKLVSRESDSELADSLFATWEADGVSLIAPPFTPAEVDSILRQKVALRKELTSEQAQQCFEAACQVPLAFPQAPGVRERAWQIATDFGFPHVYDSVYLALAELRGCEFWTADRKLVQAVKDRLSYVKWLGDLKPTG